jgi:hypothetical protein
MVMHSCMKSPYSEARPKMSYLRTPEKSGSVLLKKRYSECSPSRPSEPRTDATSSRHSYTSKTVKAAMQWKHDTASPITHLFGSVVQSANAIIPTSMPMEHSNDTYDVVTMSLRSCTSSS